MRGLFEMILLTFIAQVYAKDFMDQLVSKLADRMVVTALHHAGLDETTAAKTNPQSILHTRLPIPHASLPFFHSGPRKFIPQALFPLPVTRSSQAITEKEAAKGTQAAATQVRLPPSIPITGLLPPFFHAADAVKVTGAAVKDKLIEEVAAMAEAMEVTAEQESGPEAEYSMARQYSPTLDVKKQTGQEAAAKASELLFDAKSSEQAETKAEQSHARTLDMQTATLPVTRKGKKAEDEEESSTTSLQTNRWKPLFFQAESTGDEEVAGNAVAETVARVKAEEEAAAKVKAIKEVAAKAKAVLHASKPASFWQASQIFDGLRSTMQNWINYVQETTTKRQAKEEGTSQYSLIASGTNLPDPEKVQTGGEDAWFVKTSKQGGGVMAVADGVGSYSVNEGVDAGQYARVLSYEVHHAHCSNKNLKSAIATAQHNTHLPGAATLCMVEVNGDKLQAANIGDSGFRVIRNGEIAFASRTHQHCFNCPYQLSNKKLNPGTDTAKDAEVYDFPVQPGDIVVVGSDGLFDNVFDADIAQVATDAMHGNTALTATKAASEELVKLANKNARDKSYESPFALEKAHHKKHPVEPGGKLDDITVVVGQVVMSTAGATDLQMAVAASEQLGRSMKMEREKARLDEARTFFHPLSVFVKDVWDGLIRPGASSLAAAAAAAAVAVQVQYPIPDP